MKHCHKCGLDKPLEAFALLKTGKRYCICRQCKAAAKKTWAANNAAHVLDYQRKFFKENPEKKIDQNRRRYARHKKRMNAQATLYTKKNIERIRPWQTAYQVARREYVRKATPLWADHKRILQIYREAAAKRSAGGEWHVDHIVPIRGRNVCGLHVPENLRIIPGAENRNKFNHHTP
jgi:uncharacterized Zn finger protein (UPF0148 family)